MSQSLKEVIKDQDLFGHLININFNRKGSTHKTPIGGIFSLIIKLFVFIYVMTKFRKLLWRTDDQITTSTQIADDLGTVLDCNNEITRILGYDKEELIEENISHIMPKAYGDLHDDFIKNFLSSSEEKVVFYIINFHFFLVYQSRKSSICLK